MLMMTVAVKVKPEKREEFMQAMNSLLSAGEKQQGLRTSRLYRTIDDQNGFRLICEWETKRDLDRYLGAEKFRVLLGALKVLCEKSEVRCSHISDKLPDLVFGT